MTTATTEPTTGSHAFGQWIARHRLLTFFALAYAISWTLWLIAALLGEGSALSAIAFVAGGFGPPVAALIVLRVTRQSISTWARAIVRWRVPLRYWLYALGLPAALFGLANVILAILGEPVDLSLIGGRILPYLGTFLATLFLLGGQEEPGWRGYALPRLQERYSPLRATLLLGLAWGFWHLPLNGPIAFVVPLVLAFFYTWVYNRTGSVLLAILLHASITPAQDHLILLAEETHGTTDLAIGIVYLVGALTLVVATRGRLGFDSERNRSFIGTPAVDET